MKKWWVILSAVLLNSCLGMPENVKPVSDFELDRYLGTWYEIARLDHRFERDLSDVTANYSMRDDGGVRVLNRGYSEKKERWEDAEGKAYFVNEADEGFLKVSFFGPFYGSYVIFDLDKEDYQYAFVSGPDTSYLWFLSRTPTVSDAMIERFTTHAGELGFNIDDLIFVSQER